MAGLGRSKSASMAEVVIDIRRHVDPAKRIVFVSGNFNIVHPGHLRLLKFAKDCGDYLVVGVNDESAARLTIPSEMRLEGIRAISLVDYAFSLQESPERFIARLRPGVVVKGKEFEAQPNAEQAVVQSYGGKLLFGSGEVQFSSLDLLRREYLETNLSTIRKPVDFLARHGFTISALKQDLARLNGIRVLVIGDLIVDEYIDCEPLGMSQEDPTIVVTPLESRRFVGGAGIVAAHACGLGGDVSYIGVAGTDEIAAFARQTLDNQGVETSIVIDESRPTTLKQRFRAEGKTLLRVSHLRQHDVQPSVAAELKAAVDNAIARCDLLIFADFNYGCLPQRLVEQLIGLGREHALTMVADSQASSQMGDISRFTDMQLIAPTEREARLAMRDWNSGLVVLAEALRERARAKNVVLTLGSEGLLVHAKNGSGWETDLLPAFNTAPKDPAGAGDSFLTCAAMAACAGADIWRSVYLGSLAAACQVSRIGNVPLTQSELITEIDLP
jgi:rfaE bifunctional protein kinase chain/domain